MEYTFKGLDRGMNAAVLHVASRLFPTGFDVASDTEAPSTLEGLSLHLASTGRMLVSGDNCEGTAFGDREVNLAFRAWHDWTHWHHKTPFTLAGEIATAWLQIEHLKALGLWTPLREAWLLAEVEDQARHYAKTGAFPVDQFQMTYEGVRRRLLAAGLENEAGAWWEARRGAVEARWLAAKGLRAGEA